MEDLIINEPQLRYVAALIFFACAVLSVVNEAYVIAALLAVAGVMCLLSPPSLAKRGKKRL